MEMLQYQSLGRIKQIIRLLTVLPENPRDRSMISCTLEDVDLAEKPVYIALSYVWDEDEEDQKIRCNGSKVTVRKNLHDFLYRIRLHEWRRYRI